MDDIEVAVDPETHPDTAHCHGRDGQQGEQQRRNREAGRGAPDSAPARSVWCSGMEVSRVARNGRVMPVNTGSSGTPLMRLAEAIAVHHAAIEVEPFTRLLVLERIVGAELARSDEAGHEAGLL